MQKGKTNLLPNDKRMHIATDTVTSLKQLVLAWNFWNPDFVKKEAFFI